MVEYYVKQNNLNQYQNLLSILLSYFHYQNKQFAIREFIYWFMIEDNLNNQDYVPEEAVVDESMRVFIKEMKYHVKQGRICLENLETKINQMLKIMDAMENQLNFVVQKVQASNRLNYQHQLSEMQIDILAFTQYSTDLKIADEKNWKIVQKICHRLSQSKSNHKVKEYLEESFESSSGCFQQQTKIYSMPFLFGHRKKKHSSYNPYLR